MRTTTRLSALPLAILSLGLVACFGGQPEPTDDGSPSSASGSAVSSETAQEPLQPIVADRSDRESVADAVLESFARGDWATLAGLSSGMGVRFTPHTHVNVETDVTLLPEEIAQFDVDQTPKIWGMAEGSGEPIELSNMQYLVRYVWDHDYRTSTDIRWNATQERGNVIDNVQEVYPGASVVEYHFPGFDPQYGGMDWRSLRLVIAQNDDAQWTLYGVIHDEWAP